MTTFRSFPVPRMISISGALWALACGSSDASGPEDNVAGNTNTGNGGGTNTGNGGSGNNAEGCTEDEVFPPQAYGDGGSDLIRHIQVDAAGAIYFSVYGNIHVVQPGGSAPELVAERPGNSAPLYGTFWLDGTELLFPSTDSTGIDDTSMDVLYAVGVDGQNERVLLSTPISAPLDFFHRVTEESKLVGDELLWVEETVVRENTGLGERTYQAKRQNFRAPGEVVRWYDAGGEIDDLVVAGELAFVGVNLDEQAGSDEQRIVRWAEGTVEAMTAEQRYGGTVIAGDAESVIVSRLGEVLRLTPEATEEQRIAGFFSYARNIANRQGRWAYAEYDLTTQTEIVYLYEVGSAPRRLGCIDARGTTLHAVALTGDEVLISRYRNSTATLVRFPL